MDIYDLIPDLVISNNKYKIKDIFNKYNLTKDIDEKYLKVYRIRDDELLEDISFSEYGTSEYYWTIMIVNDMFDHIFDMALPEDTIQEMAREKASANGTLDFALYSTTYDTLSTANDAKRNIKVIKKEYLNQFLTEMTRKSINS